MIDRNTCRPLRSKPISPAKITSVANEPSPPPSLPVSTQYANGYHSSSNNTLEESKTTAVIQNGISDHHIEEEIDNDDGQWSDWEHNSDPFESDAQSLPSPAPPPPPPEQTINTLPMKSLKLNNSSKPKWDPNAPLGSEYEIPPVVLTKKKATKVETTVTQDTEDFFKDMTPKVETVELMQQLETMFSVNTNHPKQQIKSTITTTTTQSSSLSSKFGIMSQDQDDKQETESGNNNWDE